MENKDKVFFYIGQKVSHQGFGNGKVISIQNNSSFPVIVEFEDGSQRTFTLDGIHDHKQLPSLSQEPHKPLKLKEILTFEKEELVWCKFNNRTQDWYATRYSHFDTFNHFCYTQQNNKEFYSPVMQIRKFSDIPF